MGPNKVVYSRDGEHARIGRSDPGRGQLAPDRDSPRQRAAGRRLHRRRRSFRRRRVAGYPTDGHSPRWAVVRALYYLYLGGWHTVASRVPVGTNVYEREWDVLVVLDACRVDALRAVSDEYEFLDDVGSIWSVGSTSHEWVANTFVEERLPEIHRTAYVTGNGYLYRTAVTGGYPPSGGSAPFGWPRWSVADVDDFALVDDVWRDARVEEIRTVPPHHVTDRGIAAAREHDPDRLVLHYMQPHSPYIADAVEDREIHPERVEHPEPLGAMRRGELDPGVAWERYLDNLRLVLDEVELLLSNVDADRVAISADHGELFGEWGAYGHPDGLPVPAVRKVPWARTSATDTGTHAPEVERGDPETSVEEHLRGLGYVT